MQYLGTISKMTELSLFVSKASLFQFSRVRIFVTPWTVARQASLSIPNFRSLLKLMFIESVMPSNHLILCHPLFLLPSPTKNAKEVEVEQFYDDLQDLLELTPNKDVLFIIGGWNAKVEVKR